MLYAAEGQRLMQEREVIHEAFTACFVLCPHCFLLFKKIVWNFCREPCVTQLHSCCSANGTPIRINPN